MADEAITPQKQLMSEIGGGQEGVWQEYATAALRAYYPHLHDGVDYVWGRKDKDSPLEMIWWDETKFPAPDLAKIEEIATAMMEADPYRPGAEPPKPGLHARSVLGENEVPKGERAQDQPGVAVGPNEPTGAPYVPPPV